MPRPGWSNDDSDSRGFIPGDGDAWRGNAGASGGGDPGGRGGGGWRGFWARVLENPDNPIGWSIRLFTFRGITVRLHLIFILYIATMLLSSLPRTAIGAPYMAAAMGILFGLILLHEFGHCLACRAAGGEADRIVMLPWGGLALCRPPMRWKAHFLTTAGGPGVNLAIIPISCLALFSAGAADHILFNPLRPGDALAQLSAASSAALWGKVVLWQLHYVNICLLAFNLLLLFYPFDGGRLVHALLWRRLGYRRAMEIAVAVGFVGAGAVAVAALLAENVMLVLIAVFGFATCWIERSRVRAEFDLTGAPEGGSLSGLPMVGDEETEDPRISEARRRREDDEKHQAEVDRILGKIATQGMGSLSKAERKTLERDTARKRGGRAG
ncbi:MAG: hypothetical protein IBJ11_01505 [Phycisphaerales bacterium]|nr:hypothetical protein [Phycisphaerales bacterium]